MVASWQVETGNGGSCCLGTFADPALGPTLVKVGLGIQLGPSHEQKSPAEAATNGGSFVDSNRGSKVRYTQHLTLACTGETPRRPGTSSPSGQLQKTSKQDNTSFMHSIYNGKLQQALKLARANYNFFLFILIFSFTFVFHFFFFLSYLSLLFLFLFYLVLNFNVYSYMLLAYLFC